MGFYAIFDVLVKEYADEGDDAAGAQDGEESQLVGQLVLLGIGFVKGLSAEVYPDRANPQHCQHQQRNAMLADVGLPDLGLAVLGEEAQHDDHYGHCYENY